MTETEIIQLWLQHEGQGQAAIIEFARRIEAAEQARWHTAADLAFFALCEATAASDDPAELTIRARDTLLPLVRPGASAPEGAKELPPEVVCSGQHWKGMDGACAWHLIFRHSDNWDDVAILMQAWLDANR